jgi:hypothetical protein
MKRGWKRSNLQLNLLLLNLPKAGVSVDQQRDLELALAELLISAAQESIESSESEGGNESETHR